MEESESQTVTTIYVGIAERQGDQSRTDDAGGTASTSIPQETIRDLAVKCLEKQPHYFVAGLIFLELVLAVVNPLNLHQAASHTISNEIELIMSPVYGGSRSAKDNIAVILIDEKSLDHWSQGDWPPSYETQAQLIDAISTYEPAAIFLDFQYKRLHAVDASGAPIRNGFQSFGAPRAKKADESDLLKFVNALNAARSQDINIYAGEVANTTELAPLYDFFAPKNNYGEHLSPTVGVDSTSSLEFGFTYPTFDDNKHLQAAPMLYFDWCRRQARNSDEIDSVQCRSFWNWANAHTDIFVEWGFGSTQSGQAGDLTEEQRHWNKNCHQPKISYSRAARLFLQRLAIGDGDKEKNKPDTNNCRYHDFYSAADVMESGKAFTQVPKSALEGRYVLVGADVTSLSDSINNLVYGRVPGVFVHAMALDNFLTKGENVLRPSPPVLGGAGLSDIFTTMMLLLSLWVLRGVQQAKMTWATEQCARASIRHSLAVGVIAACLIIVGLIGYETAWRGIDFSSMAAWRHFGYLVVAAVALSGVAVWTLRTVYLSPLSWVSDRLAVILFRTLLFVVVSLASMALGVVFAGIMHWPPLNLVLIAIVLLFASAYLEIFVQHPSEPSYV